MAAPWNRIFSDPTFRALIANMPDFYLNLRTLARLQEAIAKCPDSLSLPIFWAHMRSCTDAEWRLTVARFRRVRCHGSHFARMRQRLAPVARPRRAVAGRGLDTLCVSCSSSVGASTPPR
jgi:hypothetical protein